MSLTKIKDWPFKIDEARQYGTDEAIFLNEFRGWIHHNFTQGNNLHNGRYWSYNTYEGWLEYFPWWVQGVNKDKVGDTPEKAKKRDGDRVRKMIGKLVDAGVLITCHPENFQRRTWISFSDKYIDDNAIDYCRVDDKSHSENFPNGNGNISESETENFPNVNNKEAVTKTVTKPDTAHTREDDVEDSDETEKQEISIQADALVDEVYAICGINDRPPPTHPKYSLYCEHRQAADELLKEHSFDKLSYIARQAFRDGKIKRFGQSINFRFLGYCIDDYAMDWREALASSHRSREYEKMKSRPKPPPEVAQEGIAMMKAKLAELKAAAN